MDYFFPAHSKISGTLKAPGSKSQMQRVLLATYLSKGKIKIQHPSYCDDARFCLQMLIDAGAQVLKMDENELVVEIENTQALSYVDCGESGFLLRMLALILSIQNQAFTLHGKETLLKRNQKDLIDFLEKSGLKVQAKEEKLPLRIEGKVKTGKLFFENLESSQYLSGMLFLLPLLKEPTTIEIQTLKSKPYIQMSLAILKNFGIEIIQKEKNHFLVPANQKYISPENFQIEGDWSGAAFWLVLAAVKGEISIENLDPNSLQADVFLLDFLKNLGVPISIEKNKITISAAKSIPAFEVDLLDHPDLFPPLIFLAAAAKKPCIFKSIHRLLNKESNRLESVCALMGKLGLPFEIQGDSLIIFPKKKYFGGEIDSFGDHRIAMLGCIFANLTEQGTIVKNFEVVKKSYPHFLDDYFRINQEST